MHSASYSTPQLYLRVKYPLRFFAYHVHPVTHATVQIKNCSKIISVIKVATMKNTDNFRYAKEAITCNHQINAFIVSKDKWNTKEDTGKSLKNALDILQYAKRHLSG